MFELLKQRKGMDGAYWGLFIIGLVLGLGLAYVALRFIPGFAGIIGL